jgi:hypothetical protein
LAPLRPLSDVAKGQPWEFEALGRITGLEG